MDNYHYYKINIKKITSNTNKKDRVDILLYFEQESSEEELKIILSIRILDEGINLIKCDSIYLTNLGDNSNDVRTVQRFLRANRIDPTNPNKKAHIFIWCEDTNLCLNAFQMLKNNDIDFNKKIRILDNNYETYYKDIENKLSNINKYDINNEIIQNINIKCLTIEELWKLKKNLLFEYCDLYKIVPLENIVYKNQKIGVWYKSQRIKIKTNLSNNIFIYNEFIQNMYVKNDLLKYADNKIVEKVDIIEQEIKNNKIMSLIDFMIKHSTIPSKFLEDYYKIIDNKNIDEINIDLETAITWLDIQKHKAKETLIKTYKKNIDYEIKKIFKLKGRGGQTKEIIIISPRCFKNMCLSTKSVRGNEVRKYFIEIETLMNKYSHYIINALKDTENLK
jgi:phage anti-repressor protein